MHLFAIYFAIGFTIEVLCFIVDWQQLDQIIEEQIPWQISTTGKDLLAGSAVIISGIFSGFVWPLLLPSQLQTIIWGLDNRNQ